MFRLYDGIPFVGGYGSMQHFCRDNDNNGDLWFGRLTYDPGFYHNDFCWVSVVKWTRLGFFCLLQHSDISRKRCERVLLKNGSILDHQPLTTAR